ncbi:hypothetical protein Poli38472_010190 [Pythium oligandrum]|uniref:Uncharacterized protein n=1 Tax=Pythium oligandrum TaxID=41045 RepID=A0A8K1C911_PYTOL|nr:hypothetical protein Poli38472_010190 [Pythium oligandrum]|eukprot:TMW58631.1 hypothetical protein Poli38472_010190 [Pythium oligandrum]
MNIAIIRRDFSLVRFLHENRSEGYDVEVLDALDEYHTRSVDRIVGLLAPNRPMDDNSRRMRLERQAKNPLQGLFKEVDEYDDDSDSDLEELLDASIVQSSE